MLLHKWCRFLMRTMSPLTVGLICFLFIGVSSSSSHHSLNSSDNNSTHITSAAETKLKYDAVHSSFAKNFRFHRTGHSTKSPIHVGRSYSSSRPIYEKESGENISDKSRTISNLNRSSRPRVANWSDKDTGSENRTISMLDLKSKPLLENGSGKNISNKIRIISNLSSNLRPAFDIGPHNSTGNKSRTMPNFSIRSRFKVKNGSDANSTIIFLPRYSRAMGNLSDSSVHKVLQPIIVSSHRRVLLEPKDYILRTESDTKYLSRREVPLNFKPLSKRRNVSENFTTKSPTKTGGKFWGSASSSKNNKTSPFYKLARLLKTEPPMVPTSESIVLFRIKSQIKHGSHSKKNSSVYPVLPITNFRNSTPRQLPQKHRRQGRNFDFKKDSLLKERETSSEIVASKAASPETTKPDFRSSSEPSDLFNYAYFSGRPRQSVLINQSELSKQESKDSAILPTSIFSPFGSFNSSYSEKKAKNLTIYEILKPRLKNSFDDFSNQSTKQSELSKHGDLIVQNHEMVDTAPNLLDPPVAEVYDSIRTNKSKPVANSFGYKNQPLVNPMVILPPTRDSNYAVEYVTVNRSNSAVISSLHTNKTTSNNSNEFGKRNSSNSKSDYSQQESNSESNPGIEYAQQEGITETQIDLLADLLRLNIEQDPNKTNSVVPQIEASSSSFNWSEDHVNANNSEYMTRLYETNSTRNIKMLSGNTSSNDSQISKQKDLLRLMPENNTDANTRVDHNKTTTESSNSPQEFSEDDEYMTQLYESDSVRKSKMSVDNAPLKNLKLDSKMFYDYFAKRPIGNVTLQDFPYPEFRPGNMFRYSDIYQRRPVLDMVFTRSTPVFKMAKPGRDLVTEESIIITPTTFNSLRTSVRVLSTFYPNRMQDVTMRFGNRVESTTLPTQPANDFRNDIDFDDDEYRDALDPGFTMEKLAYLLIGTCCGLSILCLFVVVIAIKCRRSIVEKRLKAQFRKRMYYHEKMKNIATPWQQQMFDHFMYIHRRPGESSRSTSATDSCNCRCVTWSLGARNLDSTRPLCSTNRSSSYLCGQKKLPFGAASTLRYESMLGRKNTSPVAKHLKTESPNTDSSHENDSLDLDSADSREGNGPKQCTCIDYSAWPMAPTNVPRGFFTVCPGVGRYDVGNCSEHPPVELRTIARDVPPPVTGSNYLDRSEGVVYWSSNEERLI